MEATQNGRSDDVPFLSSKIDSSKLEDGTALSSDSEAQSRRSGYWLLLAVVLIVGTVVLVSCFSSKSSSDAVASVSSTNRVNSFEFKSGAFRFLRTENGASEAILSGKFGAGLGGDARRVADTDDSNTAQTWIWDEAGVQLRVQPSEAYPSCLTVKWERLTESAGNYGDCFDLSPDQQATYWYGGAERYVQYWPINEETYNTTVFQPFDNFADRVKPGSVLESRWINSRGGIIQVDPKIHISTSMNEPVGTTCIYSSNQTLDLSYHLCGHSNVKEAQTFLLTEFTAHPTSGRPADSMLQDPIWSTWAVFHADISQTKVLDMANQVISNGFQGSNLEIDDKWQVQYGDLEFDPVKFPDPRGMIDTLHTQGFNVTLWVMPFANPESAAFVEGELRGYWVKNATGDVALVQWWQGVGAVLDVTNEAAVEWFVARLESLRTNFSVDSFKFDAGETMYLPEHGVYAGGLVHPADYTTAWVRLAARFGPLAEVRSGWQTQDAPIFTREMDRDSDWGLNNGLASVLTTAFQFGVAGYPFVLPDMIGGNGYNGSFVNIQFPTKELFIRWMEANALLPSLQMSFAPFHYDNETIEIAHSVIELHNRFAPLIIELAEQARTTSFPIVRPMYWLAPTDSTTHAIASQFALGDDVIVAPILEGDAVSRDIYLPAGVWVDDLRGTVLEGPVWLVDYAAALHELPRFVRQSSSYARL